MEDLLGLLEQSMNEKMLRATISGRKHAEISNQVRIRPVKIKEQLLFQATTSDGKREFHSNYSKEEILKRIDTWMREDYKQFQMDTTSMMIQALVNKKGKATIKKKMSPVKKEARVLDHNRKKRYILEEGVPVPFLVDLGVMTEDGKIVKARYDKFRQINRFLEFIEDIIPELEKDRELTIIDFGCGKSYLTFAMYYYLHVKKGLDIRIIGLDLKEDVIEHCQELADRYGYEKLQFLMGDIADYEGVDRVDMVVTLHACDTATDYAIQKSLKWGAKVILSVPCCQHELNQQMSSEIMAPVLKYGLIQERMAALLTDALRANVLELEGYQVQILEFIDMEHTPKNILLRAVKNPGARKEKKQEEDILACMKLWGVDPLLYRLQRGGKDEKISD